MAKIKVIQYKSGINRPMRQKLTLEALGFTKKGSMHKVIEHEATPQILGMVKKIGHLVKIVD
ncbi:MAG: 50S ribosomal protein L30 [Flavobacteriales bacterium]|jgi:large subunit ribosomal protein L30|nr:50S ribosomal protein L30 [Flavobacteriales bacterium]|tara:strand:+ start:1190 stop:1375 length:186 start_codon:yes stop_codon:yes gene_type:complete